MRLSVLSALARMDVDPWEEATRLAAMPKAIAERTLVSTLNRVLGKTRNPSETEVIAARLVQLLPQPGQGVTNITTEMRNWIGSVSVHSASASALCRSCLKTAARSSIGLAVKVWTKNR